MKRRQFITGLGSTAAALPLSARAQNTERERIVGILLPLVSNDLRAREQVSGFVMSLQQMGWVEGRNVRFETRWAGPTPSDIRRHAAELLTLGPDVVLAYGSSTVGAPEHANCADRIPGYGRSHRCWVC
jgi:putative ABC transport system substrate-binding protein